MFVEPELLASADEYRESMPEQPPAMHHAAGAIHQEAINRYWRARARREYGCSEPAHDQITALRMALENLQPPTRRRPK